MGFGITAILATMTKRLFDRMLDVAEDDACVTYGHSKPNARIIPFERDVQDASFGVLSAYADLNKISKEEGAFARAIARERQ